MSSNGFGPVTGGAHETGRLDDDQASTVIVRAIAGVAPFVRYRSTPQAVTTAVWPLRLSVSSPSHGPTGDGSAVVLAGLPGRS